MKKLLITLSICLMPLSWTASQDITIDGSVTTDNAVIETVADGEMIAIDRALLPLWYTTILQLEKSELVIDSLRMAYEQSIMSAKYFNSKAVNLEQQKRELQLIIQTQNDKFDLSSGTLQETQYQLKKWKLIGKGAIGLAALFALLAAVN